MRRFDGMRRRVGVFLTLAMLFVLAAPALADRPFGLSGLAFCASYDPMNVKFLLSPGSGSCLCCINGEFLAGMCELSAHDRIQLRAEMTGAIGRGGGNFPDDAVRRRIQSRFVGKSEREKTRTAEL